MDQHARWEVVPVSVEVEVAVPACCLPCGRCRASAKKLDQQGTAVPKDTHHTLTTDRAQLELPEQVTLAVAELASAAREGLLALAVGTGLQVLEVLLAEDVNGYLHLPVLQAALDAAAVTAAKEDAA
jgi:hypothetical protein